MVAGPNHKFQSNFTGFHLHWPMASGCLEAKLVDSSKLELFQSFQFLNLAPIVSIGPLLDWILLDYPFR